MVQKSESAVQPLLVSRRDAAVMLGNVSVSTIVRLENDGRLTPVKLSTSRNGATYYRASEIEKLVEERAPSPKRKIERYRPLALIGGAR